jgi:histone H3/H4
MSAAVANDLVLSYTALLTLLLAASLIVVIGLPPTPTLNLAAEDKLKGLSARFEAELRDGADVRARARGRNQITKKDIRAEYRERRVRKAPRALQRVTPYGGITISGVGIVIAVRSLPQFPPSSPGVSGAGALVAAMAMVFDGSEFLRGMAERRRMSKNRTGTPAALPTAHISERAEKKLRRCCERLTKDVEKEARRWAGEEEITPEDIEEAWRKLVKPRVVAGPTVPAIRPRKASILAGLGTLAELIVVAGILYFMFLLAKTKLSAGQYWPVVVVIAALFILYLALLNGPRLIAAAWEHRYFLGTIIDRPASGFMGSLTWLARKGRVLTVQMRRLFRIGRMDSDRAGLDDGKEGPAMAESTPELENTAEAATANQGSQFPVSAKNQQQAMLIRGQSPADQVWADLAAQLTPANSLARIDTVTARATITSTVIGFLVVGLGTLAAVQLIHNSVIRLLAVAAVITATLAVACALTVQVLAITRRLNPANLVDVKAWYRRQVTVRAYATQAATILLIAAVLLIGATAAATILTR